MRGLYSKSGGKEGTAEEVAIPEALAEHCATLSLRNNSFFSTTVHAQILPGTGSAVDVSSEGCSCTGSVILRSCQASAQRRLRNAF